jgi:iron complex transport system substrate-binding protein
MALRSTLRLKIRNRLLRAALCIFAALSAAEAQRAPAAATKAPGPAHHSVPDDTGRIVRVPAQVRRIVSLAPSLTETLFALGIGDRVVGVSDYCNYPEAARTRPRVGAPLNPSLETIVALRPDLVVAAKSANRRETVEELAQLGLATYATDANTVEEILISIEHLAEALGRAEAGHQLTLRLRARLAYLQQQLAGRTPKRVLLVVWHEPLISIGKKTFIADALRYAGASHVIETEQDWPRLSLEEVVRVQPEYLIFAADHAAAMASLLTSLPQRPGWRKLAAVQHHRTLLLDESINHPSPRLLDAIEALARRLHPEAFQTDAAPSPTAVPAPAAWPPRPPVGKRTATGLAGGSGPSHAKANLVLEPER